MNFCPNGDSQLCQRRFKKFRPWSKMPAQHFVKAEMRRKSPVLIAPDLRDEIFIFPSNRNNWLKPAKVRLATLRLNHFRRSTELYCRPPVNARIFTGENNPFREHAISLGQ
ncbi:hypothetical protein AVEN_187280-1 [Araneus ventricosus]|uniref:Uncharacterized protein n=1 Tax=Araneus ventricosus TaxID=182803 RepID=A0A4Y2GVG5_ARAVE|nr:hypothetical protein AVEN_187280-1 [Araneus ventricosus]